MALKCYNRQRKDGSEYTTCNSDAQKNNGKNKKSTKKNISNNKMPRAKTPPKKPAPALVRPTTPKRTAQQKRPVRTTTPVKKRPATPPLTKTQKLELAVPKGIPPEVLKTLPPARTEKNKMFLGYVTDNRPISFKKDAKKKGKAGERFDKYKSATTVVGMLRKGGTFYDFISDTEKGIITVGAKKKPVVQATVKLKPGMKLTKSKFQQQEMLDEAVAKGKVTIKKNKKNLLKKGEAV